MMLDDDTGKSGEIRDCRFLIEKHLAHRRLEFSIDTTIRNRPQKSTSEINHGTGWN
jgi:hypothetical protein